MKSIKCCIGIVSLSSVVHCSV